MDEQTIRDLRDDQECQRARLRYERTDWLFEAAVWVLLGTVVVDLVRLGLEMFR